MVAIAGKGGGKLQMIKMQQQESKKIEIFCTSIKKNGKVYYPKNGRFFHFFIKA